MNILRPRINPRILMCFVIASVFIVIVSSGNLNSQMRPANIVELIVAVLKPISLIATGVLGAIGLIVIRRKQTTYDFHSLVSSVLSATPDAVFLINRHGSILRVNAHAETQFGYASNEAMGHDLIERLFQSERADPDVNAIRDYLSANDSHSQFQTQLVVRRKGGQDLPINLSLCPIQGIKERLFIVTCQDITKQLATETELMQARDRALDGERTKSRFIAVMSHEMRTPLNGLLGTLELLSHTPLTEKQTEYLDVARRSARLLLEHVNDVLDMSKIEAGKTTERHQPFNPMHIIQDVYDVQKTFAKSRENTLNFGVSGSELGTVIGDSSALRQILLNLVNNANKFTRQGEVQIEAEALNDGENTIEFRVADTGIGIAANDLENVFKEFVTLDPNFDREAEGTGLGLPIAKKLVEAMGGQIGVESEPGEGSLFWFKIPFCQLQQDALPAVNGGQQRNSQPEQAFERPRLKILLVEDNEINRFVAREMLEADGNIVTEAQDGEAGASQANKNHFDVILMDISMPKLDGISATQRIRNSNARSSKTPIIALTAHARPDDISRYAEVGIDGYLTKPVSQNELREVLVNLGSQNAPQVFAPPRKNPEAQVDDFVKRDILFQLVEILGQTRVDHLLAKFYEEAEEIISELGIVTASQQLQSGTQKIHRLAGSASTFGAHRLQTTLANLEEQGVSGKTDVFLQIVPKLPALLKETKAALQYSLDQRLS